MIKEFTITLPSDSSLLVKATYNESLKDFIIELPKTEVLLGSDLIKIGHQIDETKAQNYKYKQ